MTKNLAGVAELAERHRPECPPGSGTPEYQQPENQFLAAEWRRQLDLAQSPFRLLAIVNRVDLRENSIYGGGDAGEGRLVFGAIG